MLHWPTMRDQLGNAGRKLWTHLVFGVTRIWRFVGRVGLAQRRLIFWLIWEPFLYVTTPVRRLALYFWRFWGRLGLAFRRLLAWFSWPLRLPLGWLYRRTLQPMGRWLWARIRKSARRRWQAGGPKRAFFRRRVASRWMLFRARLRVLLRRRRPPETAITAPRIPAGRGRSMRIATLIVSVSIVLTASLISWQDPQPDPVAAGSFLTRIVIATPSPAPATPQSTPEPTAVKLTPWPTPDPLQGGGSLAFEYHQNGNSDIYLLPVGQSELIRLTSHPAADRQPVWSPGGRELAFSSRRDGNWEIYVYDFARGQLRRLTDDPAFDAHPDWSPDGQWLVYESYQQNNLDLYIVKADGSEGPYRITENPALDFSPTWSPGGRHVAFTSWRDGSKDIFLLSLDAASDEAAVNVSSAPGTHEDDPAFSPDGRFLAYSQQQVDISLIYALPLAEDYTVAGLPTPLGQQGHHPTWSPDNQSLVYAHHQGDSYFLVASSPDAWGVAPQAFVADDRLGSPSWSAVHLSPDMAAKLGSIDPDTGDPPLYVEALAADGDGAASDLLWELPVSAPSPYLSDQVDQSFLALRERVREEAGWDLLGRLDGMFEAIDSRPLPGQPGRDWNKTGRAFDLYYREALAFEPRLEVVRQDLSDGIYWRIYVKAAQQDGSQGEPLRDIPWDFQARYGNEPRYYDQGGKLKEAIPAGYYVDFTALAADYGWSWVPSAKDWRTYFPAIRFWRYEKHQGLTWEEAMRQLYTAAELERLP